MLNENDYNTITRKIIECAIEVHRELGPGLIESVYDACLKRLLVKCVLKVKSQVMIPIYFKGEMLDKCFKIDLLVEDVVVVELKSLEPLLPIHEAQLVTYLKLANKKLGLLLNFNVVLLKDGIRRRINGQLNS